MARPPTQDQALKLNLTLPKSVRSALISHVNEQRREEPGITVSSFIANLLRRTLNLSGPGTPPSQRAQIETLWNEIQKYSVQNGRASESDETLNALIEGVSFKNQELSQAIPWFVLEAARNPDRFRRSVVDSKRILIPRVNYTDFGYAISDLIHDWAAKQFFGPTRFEFADPGLGAFDAAINLEYPLTEKVLYLFPFFLTEFRRPWAGVVRYAEHKAIGWIVHKESSFLARSELDSLKENGMKERDDGAKRLRLKFLSRLFSELTKTTDKEPACLIVEDNYLRREMIPLLISNCEHGVPVEKFSARNFFKTEPRINDKNEEGAVRTVIDELADRKNDVILFDLGWNKTIVKIIEEDSSSNHVVIRSAHEQDIPVGVGFSLPALPFMGREIDGKSVAAAFLDEVRKIETENQNLKAELMKDGILLDDLT